MTQDERNADFWLFWRGRKRINNGYLNKVDARYLLSNVCKIMYKHQIPHWLVFGTLLGAYRDKDFIEYDTDIDVGFLAEDRERIRELIRSGVFKKLGISFCREWDTLYSLRYRNEYLDIVFFESDGECYRNEKLKVQHFQLDEEPSAIEFLGEIYTTVHDIPAFLVAHYGENWKERIKNKHAIV